MELLRQTLDTIYILGQKEGLSYDKLVPFDTSDLKVKKLKERVAFYSKTILLIHAQFTKKLKGDYFLNSRNSDYQKMLKLNLYFGNEEISTKIISYISRECCNNNGIQFINFSYL